MENNFEYVSASGETWYYDETTGLYYSSPNCTGIGYTLSQLERFDEGVI